GPVAGIAHAVFILAFMVIAAPLASYAPLAALAGVLAIVAWNMFEKEAFASLLRASKGDAAALTATFLLTVFRDLTEAIIAGVAIGAIAFIHRMSETAALSDGAAFVIKDQPDGPPESRTAYEGAARANREIAVYRLSGALFFGSAASLGVALDRVLRGQKTLILDFSAVTMADSTGANAIASFTGNAARRGIGVIIAGASAPVRRELLAGGLSASRVAYESDVESALATAEPSSAQDSPAAGGAQPFSAPV
ncbi:MAG: SulP family inorganic anion transporter, partial [Parvularculaceae bacterium]|nr:SulP family inorganic anion transporter [Parvularculaceae bacterium]